MAKKKAAKIKKKASSRANVKRKTVKKVAAKRKNGAKRSTKVTPIPKGYNSITPYLIIGKAAEAINFYKKAFGAKEVLRIEHRDGKIGHAELKIGDTKIMLADEFPEMNARGPRTYGGSPVSIHLYIKNVDSIVDNAVAAGAKLTRPVENMFYGDRSGTLEDPFGHKWHVATHVENVTPAKMKKRATELFDKK